jgi:hypothetical protein
MLLPPVKSRSFEIEIELETTYRSYSSMDAPPQHKRLYKQYQSDLMLLDRKSNFVVAGTVFELYQDSLHHRHPSSSSSSSSKLLPRPVYRRQLVSHMNETDEDDFEVRTKDPEVSDFDDRFYAQVQT